MQVISVNIGKPKSINWRGKEVRTGMFKYPINKAIFLGKEDVKNDHVNDRHYHGGIDKACYLFSKDHYNFWKKKYPGLDWNWGMFGENLTISDLDETQLMIGDVFQVGGATIQITQPRQPCFKLGVRFGSQKMIKQFVESGHSGAYVRIVQEGLVQKNDKMELIDRANDNISIKEVFSLIYGDQSRIDQVRNVILIDSLAEACKNDLKKHFKL